MPRRISLSVLVRCSVIDAALAAAVGHSAAATPSIGCSGVYMVDGAPFILVLGDTANASGVTAVELDIDRAFDVRNRFNTLDAGFFGAHSQL